MRLRLRAGRDGPSHTGRREHRATDRHSPPSVLTSWLRQGLRSSMCPLCRVAHKADREYIWHFFDEGADQGESMDAVRAAFGFCSEHIEMLRRIDMEGMKSTLSISTMFADTFRHEPKGAKRDSWQRAILLTVGWLAPAESAAEPERRQ